MHDHVHERQRRALAIALVINGVLLVAEVIGGLLFNSLALLADAAHMASDVIGLAIALAAQKLMDRPASARHSFGLMRMEVLGASLNGMILLGASGWILYEAIKRFGDPATVEGGGLLVVASLGLLVNLVSAVLIARQVSGSLNMRGALVHMAADAAGSFGAMVAGVSILVWNALWVDPAISILIAVLIVWSSWDLLSKTVHVLLEGTPRGIDPDAVERELEADDAVEQVHHLHMWSIASDFPAFSAHVVLKEDMNLHDAQQHGERLKRTLAERFGIQHATLQLECHVCDPHRQVPSDAGHP